MSAKTLLRPTSIKLVAGMSLFICCMLCCIQNAFSGTRKTVGNKIFYDGNVFETKSADTETVLNGNAYKIERQVSNHAPRVVKLNGVPIYQYDVSGNPNVSNDVIDKSTNTLNEYLLNSAAPLLQQLDDGVYNILVFHPIIDEKGRLVYYEDPTNDTMLVNITSDKSNNIRYDKVPEGFLNIVPANVAHKSIQSSSSMFTINKTLKIAIDKKIQGLLDVTPVMNSLYQNGKAVPYEITGAISFEVKDHKLLPHHFSPLSGS